MVDILEMSHLFFINHKIMTNKFMYCRAPFVSASIRLNEVITPCCLINWHYNLDYSRKKFFNNEYIIDRCKTCVMKGDYDHTKYNANFLKNIKYYINGQENYCPASLHIRLNNDCNHNCIICDRDLQEPIQILDIEIVKKYITQELKEVYMMGGELFLHKHELIKILYEIYNKSPKCNVYIISNLSIIHDDVIDLLKKHNGTIVVSLDGYKQNNDITRIGSSYNRIINNINKLSKEINIEINYTVSVLNLINILQDVDNIKKDLINPIKIRYNLLLNPDYLNIKNLPLNIKKEMIDKLTKFNKNDMYNVIKLLEQYGNYMPTEIQNHIKKYSDKYFNSNLHFDKDLIKLKI